MKLVKKWFLAGLLCLTLTGSLGYAHTVNAQSLVHIVQPGDTLWKIAQTYQVDLNQLIQANQLSNIHLIYPGERINLPVSHKSFSSEQAFAEKVVELTNAERAKYGLKPLKFNQELAQVARLKSQDMAANNYFDHYSPTYGSPFEMMNQFGIQYSYAGENIAAGQRTPEEVVQAWMNSPGHRANMLNEHFTQIGVGFVKGGAYQYYWTQMFI